MRFNNYTKEYKIQLTKELLKEVESDLLNEKEPEIKISKVGNFYDETMEFIQNPNKDFGIATGFNKVDQILRGFMGGELIILTGVSGHGKTTFLEAMLINMALNNEPVLFISMEEGRKQVVAKLIKQIQHVDQKETLKELPIYLYDGEIADINVLEAIIQEAVKNGIKFVAVDNIGFFTNRDTEIESETSIKLKLMARKYNIPILAIAHLRKLNNVDKIPTMDDIKGSSSIYQDADQFMCLWQDMTGSKTVVGNMLLLIRKNRRYGTRGTIEFHLNEFLFPIEVTSTLKDTY